MIEFFKNYFSKPSYLLTGYEKLIMSLIVIGMLIAIISISLLIYFIYIKIKERKRRRRNND